MLRRIVGWITQLAHIGFANPIRRFQLSIFTLLALVVFSTVGYMLLEKMRPVDALYMTVITITTVGFGEVRELSEGGRIFTIIVILIGVSAATNAISNAVGVILGPRLWMSIRQRTMERDIVNIKNHYIVCGYGRMGRQVVEDLLNREEQFVLVESDIEAETHLIENNVPYVIGDATQDEVLIHAGIERARGLVAAANSDADNVMIILSARELNPKLLIVARASQSEVASKLRRAGANRVVSPYQIGGHRIALALMRPAVNDFLDHIFHFREDLEIDIGQVTIYEGASLAGKTLISSELRDKYNVSILALREPDGELLVTPQPTQTLKVGMTIIIIGPPEQIYALEKEYAR